MELTEQYSELKKRFSDAERKLANLQGVQQSTLSQKERLESELKAEGIDVDNLEAAEEKLTKQITTLLNKANTEVAQFEQALSEASGEDLSPVQTSTSQEDDLEIG